MKHEFSIKSKSVYCASNITFSEIYFSGRLPLRALILNKFWERDFSKSHGNPISSSINDQRNHVQFQRFMGKQNNDSISEESSDNSFAILVLDCSKK